MLRYAREVVMLQRGCVTSGTLAPGYFIILSCRRFHASESGAF